VKKQTKIQSLLQHQKKLKSCQTCPNMIGPVITCEPVISPIILIGQAPGDREGVIGKPFGWTLSSNLLNTLPVNIWQLTITTFDFLNFAHIVEIQAQASSTNRRS